MNTHDKDNGAGRKISYTEEKLPDGRNRIRMDKSDFLILVQKKLERRRREFQKRQKQTTEAGGE